jgi:hypothetical protein
MSRTFIAAMIAAVASASCGDIARTGRSPMILVIDRLEASAGGGSQFAAFLLSDVLTGGSVINDSGRATLSTTLKNPGFSGAPLGPTELNTVVIERYRVEFIRTDGRSTQGVDLPFAFEGGLTATVPPNGSTEVVFDLVRHTSKSEPPLNNLRFGGAQNLINTIAQITFFGHDLAGNEIQATGNIQVNFGDFADPS